MNKCFSHCIILILLVSCNNYKKKDAEKASSNSARKTSFENCYVFKNRNDTIILKLTHEGESISGTLVYVLKEKDKNKGTIQGYMTNNVLIADYSFMSEGVQSIRQVAFKKVDAYFVEGYGEMNFDADKVTFKHIDSLHYNNAIQLVEEDCQK